jgi:hypothetical protein
MSSITPLYSSPVNQSDALTGQPIQLYRDPQTGAPLYQVPTEAQLLAQQPAAQATAQAATTTAQPAALYSSPTIEIDPATGQAILLFRDQQTGETQYQVPSSAQLQAYRPAPAPQTGTRGTVA